MRVRGRELAAAKFRRQYSIGPYIVDFCSIDHRLVIELDGGQHLENVDADRERTVFLERLGFPRDAILGQPSAHQYGCRGSKPFLNNLAQTLLSGTLETPATETLTLPSPLQIKG